MTAVHMDSSSFSTMTTTQPQPWLPADHHHHLLLHDLKPPFVPASSHHRLLLLPPPPSSSARNNNTKRRRPRPSRKLPTTYINADPASFRRMVQQVTGAEEDDLLPLPRTTGDELLVARAAAPLRAATSSAHVSTVLPTLDTSAFLVSRRTPPTCDGSSATATATAAASAGGACCSTGSASFPTLDSWDHHHHHHHAPLFSTHTE